MSDSDCDGRITAHFEHMAEFGRHVEQVAMDARARRANTFCALVLGAAWGWGPLSLSSALMCYAIFAFSLSYTTAYVPSTYTPNNDE